jgi:hypothetical protein
MFSYSTGYYVSPPDDQYLKFKNRCSLLYVQSISSYKHLQQSPFTGQFLDEDILLWFIELISSCLF